MVVLDLVFPTPVTTFNMLSLLSFRFEASFLSGRENSTTFNLLLYTLSHCHCVSVAKSNVIMNYPSHACSMVFWMCWQIEWPALCPRVRDTPVQLNLLISRHIPFVLFSPPDWTGWFCQEQYSWSWFSLQVLRSEGAEGTLYFLVLYFRPLYFSIQHVQFRVVHIQFLVVPRAVLYF